jgi:hypothetical protein
MAQSSVCRFLAKPWETAIPLLAKSTFIVRRVGRDKLLNGHRDDARRFWGVLPTSLALTPVVGFSFVMRPDAPYAKWDRPTNVVLRKGPFVRRPAGQRIGCRTIRPYAMNAMRRPSTALKQGSGRVTANPHARSQKRDGRRHTIVLCSLSSVLTAKLLVTQSRALSLKLVSKFRSATAGPSTTFDAKNASNSAQDDSAFQDDRAFYDLDFRPRTLVC